MINSHHRNPSQNPVTNFQDHNSIDVEIVILDDNTLRELKADIENDSNHLSVDVKIRRLLTATREND